jgi:hypothetical protein
MKENESEKISENNLGKNKRPCSLYFNKNVIGKEKEKEKCNISLNDYFNYNNAVYKNNNLTINNININQNNYKNEFDINNNINKLSKLNINLKKFMGINPNNSTQNLYLPTHLQNKYSNNLTDSSSAFIIAQLHSLNNNKNSKTKSKNNLENKNSNTCFSQRNLKEAEQMKKEVELLSNNKTKQKTVVNYSNDSNEMKENNNCELNNNCVKDINDIRKKISKINVQHSAKPSKKVK